MIQNKQTSEKLLIIAGRITSGRQNSIRNSFFEYDLAETRQLAEASGGRTVSEIVQTLDKPRAQSFFGQGKLEEIAKLIEALEIDKIICHNQLSPRQASYIEEVTQVPVIDRIGIILQIFADRAQSSSGKLQVEAAQLAYLLSRLSGKGTMLSRLGGGIGTRGPGETKLETDRRRIRQRLSTLEKRLAKLKQNRSLLRTGRKSVPFPVISLAGYTNAGKSSLLNALVNLNQSTATLKPARVSNQVFATLDPSFKRIEVSTNLSALLSDTVGFIRDLPRELKTSFAATLEEIRAADLIILVVDASAPQHQDQLTVARDIIKELKAEEQLKIIVNNKIDLLNQKPSIKYFEDQDICEISLSALSHQGIELLTQEIESCLSGHYHRIVNLYFPPAEIAQYHRLCSRARIISTAESNDFTENSDGIGIKVTAELQINQLKYFKKFFINN